MDGAADSAGSQAHAVEVDQTGPAEVRKECVLVTLPLVLLAS